MKNYSYYSYKPDSRVFDYGWCQWNFLSTQFSQ